MNSIMGSILQIQGTDRRPIGWVALFVALSWAGEFLHNRYELPQLRSFSPENSLMALLAIGLFLLWWRAPGSSIPAVLLLVLGILHLLGGSILTVLPLPFLPFVPEQSLPHYIAHIVYGLLQAPLIVAMIWQIRQFSRAA
jgi:hypothetical protein